MMCPGAPLAGPAGSAAAAACACGAARARPSPQRPAQQLHLLMDSCRAPTTLLSLPWTWQRRQARSVLYNISIMEMDLPARPAPAAGAGAAAGSRRQPRAALLAAGCRCCRSSARPPAVAPRAPPRQHVRPGTPASVPFCDQSGAKREAGLTGSVAVHNATCNKRLSMHTAYFKCVEYRADIQVKARFQSCQSGACALWQSCAYCAGDRAGA